MCRLRSFNPPRSVKLRGTAVDRSDYDDTSFQSAPQREAAGNVCLLTFRNRVREFQSAPQREAAGNSEFAPNTINKEQVSIRPAA